MPGKTTSSYNDAVAGLYRLILEPEAVIDLVLALDSLAESGAGDQTLDELRAQFSVAQSLSERIVPNTAQPTIEYVLLRRDRRIAAVEDTTDVFARLGDDLSPGSLFLLRDADAQIELETILAALGAGEQRFMIVHHSKSEPPLTLALVRAPENSSMPGAFLLAAPRPTAWSQTLQIAFESFDLTAAELRVLRSMRADQGAAELAERLGVSEHTVRTQIKSILAKVGMSRQSEVVRFREEAMRLSGVVREQMRRVISDAERRNPPFFPSGRIRPQRFIARLKSGRDISYREFGNPEGQAVLVLHGAHAGSMIPEGFKPVADALGLRLIAPDRPGFGESSPTSHDLEIAHAASDTLMLLDKMRVTDFHVLGLASGSATGVEVASASRGARDLTLCSAHFGSANSHRGAGFGFFLREQMFRRAPWLLEHGSRFMWQHMTPSKLRSIVSALSRKSPADFELIHRDGLVDYFADVVMDALQAPPDGHIWEVQALDRYKIDVSRITVAVALLFGEEDPVTDAEGVKEIFAQLSEVTLETFPGGGQLFFYERWRQILQRFRPSD